MQQSDKSPNPLTLAAMRSRGKSGPNFCVQQLMGMVTDRNITNRATAYGHDPNTTPVRHYMSSDLICCFEDQDIKEAEELMRQRRVRGLPILTREKQIAGIVALDDLIPVCWIPKKVGPLPPERFRARARGSSG